MILSLLWPRARNKDAQQATDTARETFMTYIKARETIHTYIHSVVRKARETCLKGARDNRTRYDCDFGATSVPY